VNAHLYDAAGNRVLWLDARGLCGEIDHGQLKMTGFELSQRCQFGQEITAVLFTSARGHYALFWNPDGTYEMVCGNAIRCLAHFICDDSAALNHVPVETPRGHYLSRKLDANQGSVVMPDHTIRVAIPNDGGDLLVDAGTPHRIRLVNEEWPDPDLREARSCSGGANPVNFNLVRKIAPFHHRVRTFERGVGETSSCGTAAVAIVAALEALGDALVDLSARHLIQFASGEQLFVTGGRSLGSYEITGRVTLLQDISL
jgi:diaminopimelate epimerase